MSTVVKHQELSFLSQELGYTSAGNIQLGTVNILKQLAWHNKEILRIVKKQERLLVHSCYFALPSSFVCCCMPVNKCTWVLTFFSYQQTLTR